MQNAFFEVLGSEGDVYRVTFVQASGGVRVSCTCRAGMSGLFCKHRLALMAGDRSRMVSPEKADELDLVMGWAELAPIKEQIAKLHQVQGQIDELEKVEAGLKKAVAKAVGAK